MSTKGAQETASRGLQRPLGGNTEQRPSSGRYRPPGQPAECVHDRTTTSNDKSPLVIAAKMPLDIAGKSFGLSRARSRRRVNRLPGSNPLASSAYMQNTSLFTKCATACGSCPRLRRDCDSSANAAAAFSVKACRDAPGWSLCGSLIAHFSVCHTSVFARSSMVNSCVRLSVFVQFVQIRNRTMSDTIRSGGCPTPTHTASVGRMRRRGRVPDSCTPMQSNPASTRPPDPCPPSP